MIADSRAFHPITPNIRQVDAFNAHRRLRPRIRHFGGVPEKYRNCTAFVCALTGKFAGHGIT